MDQAPAVAVALSIVMVVAVVPLARSWSRRCGGSPSTTPGAIPHYTVTRRPTPLPRINVNLMCPAPQADWTNPWWSWRRLHGDGFGSWWWAFRSTFAERQEGYWWYHHLLCERDLHCHEYNDHHYCYFPSKHRHRIDPGSV